MAGQHATLISEVPADRQETITWTGSPRTQYLPLLIAERDKVVHWAAARYGVAEGSAMTGALVKAADGVDPSSATTTITASVDFNATEHEKVEFTLTKVKGVPSENIVKAGEMLLLQFNGDPATLDDVCITVRVSDRLN